MPVRFGHRAETRSTKQSAACKVKPAKRPKNRAFLRVLPYISRFNRFVPRSALHKLNIHRNRPNQRFMHRTLSHHFIQEELVIRWGEVGFSRNLDGNVGDA